MNLYRDLGFLKIESKNINNEKELMLSFMQLQKILKEQKK